MGKLPLNICIFNEDSTRFMAVRYGNVLGSNGSVLGIFLKQIKEGKHLTVTNPDMTRFWITLPEVCHFIINTLEKYDSGIHIPLMISSKIQDLVDALFSKLKVENKSRIVKMIPSQTNEKIHESLTTLEECARTDYNGDRLIVYSEPVPYSVSLAKQYTSETIYPGSHKAQKQLNKMLGEIL